MEFDKGKSMNKDTKETISDTVEALNTVKILILTTIKTIEKSNYSEEETKNTINSLKKTIQVLNLLEDMITGKL